MESCNGSIGFLEIFCDFIRMIGSVVLGILEGCCRFFYAPHKSLEDEIVVLTGAAGGFGTLLAEKMALKGCTMVLLDINEKDLKLLADKINDLGLKNKAHYYRCDVTSEEEVLEVSSNITKKIGNPTMLLNNAGIVAGRYLKDLKQEDVLRTFNVNVLSHYTLLRSFLPDMLEKNHGHIVSIASILAVRPAAGVCDYAPSKAAAASYMEAVRQEIRLLGKDGVHCTSVLPYQVNTQLFKGCTIRFKNLPLFNVLSVDYVTDKIIDAIQKNQITLCLPRISYVMVVLLHLLPECSSDAMFDFLAANNAMQYFVGRDKKTS